MKILKYILIIIAVLLVLIIIKVLLTPRISYETQIKVDKPQSEAWAVMSDVTKAPEWIKGFKKSELISGTANTVGAVSNIYFDEGGKEMVMKETITKIEPDKMIAMNFSMDFMDMDYEMYLSEENGSTLIKTKTETKGNSFMARCIVAFMGGSMKKQEDINLNNLKEVIEKNTKAYPQN